MAHAFQGVLASTKEKEDGRYLVGQKTKDKCEIDGVARSDVTYLSPENKKHGASAVVYRLSGRRKADYKGARAYLEELASSARGESGLTFDEKWEAQGIQIVIARSRSKGCIEMDDVEGKVAKILEGVETKAENSAEAVKKDFSTDGNVISHFLDDFEAAKTGNDVKVARENIRQQGNAELLKGIVAINKQAKKLGRDLDPNTVSQLKLGRRFIASASLASAAAGEPTVKNLLDKIAGWPGPDLQIKLAFLFERAKPEPGSKSFNSEPFKQASKALLLALAEQESILDLANKALTSDEFLSTIPSGDREKLQALGKSAEKLLTAFLDPGSPFARLKNLASAGYHLPTETAKQVVAKREEFSRSLFSGNVPPPPVVVSLPPDDVPPLPVVVSPPPDDVPPPPVVVSPPPDDVPPPPVVASPPPDDVPPPPIVVSSPPDDVPPPPLDNTASQSTAVLAELLDALSAMPVVPGQNPNDAALDPSGLPPADLPPVVNMPPPEGLLPLPDAAPPTSTVAPLVSAGGPPPVSPSFGSPPPAELLPSPPAVTASKLLDDLKAEGTYLTASKVDDGKGHKVVTRDNQVLYLKAGKEQETTGRLQALLKKMPHGRRAAQYKQTRIALQALVEDAEVRGVIKSGWGDTDRDDDGITIKHLLATRKGRIEFKSVQEHVKAILSKDVKGPEDAAGHGIDTSAPVGQGPQVSTVEPAEDSLPPPDLPPPPVAEDSAPSTPLRRRLTL
ncbi:hypothetical protein C7T35_33315 [Variovorax sp. WS11]|uniref:hypothetical protein n=1 Tax=Variovorax sp. WS11 TaxID=1105204 RepID=UPI000D0D85AF|nr:hypothetical protein [Variovorax sp. WS11]NDZ16748.1 hypothetical protein [Variovorax sp. WS11]PSL80216.1 hypothetical protein C7T35_33315 [Variovorax sp. WS11]